MSTSAASKIHSKKKVDNNASEKESVFRRHKQVTFS